MLFDEVLLKDIELRKSRPHLIRLIIIAQKWDIWSRSARRRLLKWAGFDIADSAIIECGCDFRPGNISIGEMVYINRDVFLDASSNIVVEQNVRIGPRVTIVTSTHEIGNETRRAGRSFSAPIRIGAGTWIGAGSLVLAGVSIGKRSILAAGTVATKDLGDDGLFCGVPAKLKRNLPRDLGSADDNKNSKNCESESSLSNDARK